jgi:hypothetical protein
MRSKNSGVGCRELLLDTKLVGCALDANDEVGRCSVADIHIGAGAAFNDIIAGA